jgi:predicted HicB family RNase H-like nuclease
MDTTLQITRRETHDKMLCGVRMTTAMHSAAEARAAALGCTLSEYVRALLRQDIDAQDATHARRASAKQATR